MGKTSERRSIARVKLRNEGASRGYSFGAREQRANKGSERESAHKPVFDARERRAGKGWSRLVCFQRLRVRYAGLVPVAWCRVIPCHGMLLTTAAPSPPARFENSWKERNRGTIVTVMGTGVNGTVVNNDKATQPNRGRVAALL